MSQSEQSPSDKHGDLIKRLEAFAYRLQRSGFSPGIPEDEPLLREAIAALSAHSAASSSDTARLDWLQDCVVKYTANMGETSEADAHFGDELDTHLIDAEGNLRKALDAAMWVEGAPPSSALPLEPTPEMIAAARRFVEDAGALYDHGIADVWRAMYRAAPSHATSNDERDAARYRWLKDRFYGADFAYGSPPAYIIAFRMDNDAKVSGNLDATIDATMNTPIAASATRRSE